MKRIDDFLLIIKHFKIWRYWRKVKRGVKTIDQKMGVGYYFMARPGCGSIGLIKEFETNSGRIGLYELIYYETFSDPWDMIKYSLWHLIGYKGQKAIKDCTFRELLEIYFHKK